MRRAAFPLLGLVLLLPALPALPGPHAGPEDPWWLQPLAIPELPPSSGAEASTLTPPYLPGDDVLVPVPRNQDEFSIAANPLDPDHLVVGANDYSRGDAWAGVFVSFDGGATWEHGYIPMPAIYTVSGDPALAFDKDGNVYYGGIAFNRGSTNGGANAIFISKSTDGGRTWTTTAPFKSPSSSPFHDKPYIGVDPNTGAVYLTYTHFGSGGGISFSKSTDGGLTWTPRKVIGSGQFSLPIAGLNGEIYVTWASGGGAVFARSLDGGNTFTTQNVMALGLGTIGVPFRYFSYPVMEIARSGPHTGRIYLAGPQLGGGTGPDLKVVSSDDRGATWSAAETIARPGSQFMPWMAIMPDGTVGIAYMDTLVTGALGRFGDLLVEGTILVQSLSIKAPGDTGWTTMVTTDVPSPATATNFWGDYQGLAATSKGFHPAFGDARGMFCDVCGTTDGAPDFATMRVLPLALPVP